MTKTAKPANPAKAAQISILQLRKTRNSADNPATNPRESGDPPADLVRQAIQDLGLDVPYYTCRVVGNRLEFVLATGAIAVWDPRARAGSRPIVGAGSPRPKG